MYSVKVELVFFRQLSFALVFFFFFGNWKRAIITPTQGQKITKGTNHDEDDH